jgi:hypothetical protein
VIATGLNNAKHGGWLINTTVIHVMTRFVAH